MYLFIFFFLSLSLTHSFFFFLYFSKKFHLVVAIDWQVYS